MATKRDRKNPQFVVVKSNFDKGLWTADTVKKAVKTGKITEAEFQEITGEKYTA